MVKRLFLLATLMATVCGLHAQEYSDSTRSRKCPIEATLGTDFVTSYIWRGQKCANPSFQPFAGLSWKGLSLGIWGNVAVVPVDSRKGTQEEIDITLSYELKGFHVGVTDYYFFENGYSFFTYGGIGECAHTFEGNIGWGCKYLSVDWFTNFAGNDGTTLSGKRAYSSYLLLQAPFRLAKLNWNAAVGVVPYSTDFYSQDNARNFHCNNVSLRAEYPIKCGRKFTLPVYAQVIANPSNGKFYFLAGFTVKAL